MDACSPSSDHEGVILDSIVHFPKPKVEEAVNRDATPTSSGPASRSSKLHGFDLNIDLDENGEIAPAIDELVAKEEEEQECDGPGNEATKELDVHSDNVLGGTLHMQGSELHSSVHPDEDDYDWRWGRLVGLSQLICCFSPWNCQVFLLAFTYWQHWLLVSKLMGLAQPLSRKFYNCI